jgi:hypothetical protein
LVRYSERLNNKSRIRRESHVWGRFPGTTQPQALATAILNLKKEKGFFFF